MPTKTKPAITPAPELRTIDLGDLIEHPKNVRRDVGDVTELAASIEEQGILEPLIVAPHNVDRVPSASILQPGSSTRAWLDFLVDELGYELTTWEAERLAAVDERVAQLAAAVAAEEAADDGDDAA